MEGSIYSPLIQSERQIRLVTLIPSLDRSSPVRCTLSTVSLDDRHGYMALSYTWGDHNKTAPIVIDDVEFQATVNLETALRYMRPKEGPPAGPRIRLWIDAICINQKDKVERSQQVQLMKTIFTQAGGVLVWIGEEGPDARLAVETIARLKKVFEDNGNERVPVLEAINKLDGTPEFNAILGFFDRPWWLRLWTLQEYIFAKEILFVCGEFSFNWSLLDWWSHIIAMKGNPFEWKSEQYAFINLIWGRGPAGLFAKSFLRRLYLKEGKINQRLSKILRQIDPMMCSDPRDRIYAVQALANDGDQFPPPDYSISVSDLFIKVASIMVQAHEDLLVLHYGPRESAEDGVALPSWVPDWGAMQPRALNLDSYQASQGRKAITRISLLPTPTLYAQGVIWDRVTRVDHEPMNNILHMSYLTDLFYTRRTELFNGYENAKSQLPEGMSSQSQRRIWCDNCIGPVLRTHYHCGTCEEGNFDLCPGCAEDGIWCGDKNHRLSKRDIINNVVDKSDTESIEHGSIGKPIDHLSPDLTPFWARMIYEDRPKAYPTGIPQLQAYFRTILFDVDASSNSRLSSSTTQFFNYAKQFALVLWQSWFPPCSELGRWRRNVYVHLNDQMDFAPLFGEDTEAEAEAEAEAEENPRPLEWPYKVSMTTLMEESKDGAEMTSFAGLVSNQTRSRRFFVTEKGYMGLGPPKVEVGDVVCVFPGLNVPVILEKSVSADGAFYTHRGECFVLGIMDGEVMAEVDKGTVSLEEIEIH